MNRRQRRLAQSYGRYQPKPKWQRVLSDAYFFGKALVIFAWVGVQVTMIPALVGAAIYRLVVGW